MKILLRVLLKVKVLLIHDDVALKTPPPQNTDKEKNPKFSKAEFIRVV